MKKTYNKPEMLVIKIAVRSLMAGSIGKGEGTINAGSSDSRRGSYWDDGDDAEDY